MKKGRHQQQLQGRAGLPDFQSVYRQPYILDGAIGSYLQRSGFDPDPALWFSHLNIINPESVLKVHQDYITAGADIITTNTFRTNPAAVTGSGFTSAELVQKAVYIARESAKGEEVFIAGSNPPAEDSYQRNRVLSLSKLRKNHSVHISQLMESGCDFILNETQGHSDEIQIICEVCSNEQIPFIISLYFDSDFRILSGESVFEIIDFVFDSNPLAIGFNCINIEVFRLFLANFNSSYPWGFYLNYGLGDITDSKITDSYEPGYEFDVIKSGLEKKAKFIGGCCGSGPEHIKHIKNIIYGNNNP
jgi:homocysteine S-methyltransferase